LTRRTRPPRAAAGREGRLNGLVVDNSYEFFDRLAGR
jgi:hypothetical protein